MSNLMLISLLSHCALCGHCCIFFLFFSIFFYNSPQVRFNMTTAANTPGVIQLGGSGRSYQDITFQFVLGTDGLAYLNLNGTHNYDEEASKPNPALCLCPCCWCVGFSDVICFEHQLDRQCQADIEIIYLFHG